MTVPLQVTDRPKVWLGSLPWTNLDQPSLGLGILKSVLIAEDIETQIEHLNLEMLRFCKPQTYSFIERTYGLNDFVFSGVLAPDIDKKQMRRLHSVLAEYEAADHLKDIGFDSLEAFVEGLVVLRNETVPRWLREVAARVLCKSPTLIGLTCLFDQTIASIALASSLDKVASEQGIRRPLIALGGYAVRNPTGSMLLNAFPFLDAICIEEGENTMAPLARASVGSERLENVPGIVFRDRITGECHKTPAETGWVMDDIPPPDYSDFFNDIANLEASHDICVPLHSLPIENSRGCWWGQKKHCVFCGIKSSDLVYRHKAAETVLSDIARLVEAHDTRAFRFADYILPNAYYRELLPKLIDLVDEDDRYEFAGEIKANINAEKFELFSRANFSDVQPGIESLSTNILNIMDKGVNAVTCVYLLRLGQEFGVKVFWNLLYGFPGEDVEPYRNMVRFMPTLFHLEPPMTCLPVQITRFAPLQVDPARFEIDVARPHPRYEMIFSQAYLEETGFRMEDFAYTFERPFRNAPRNEREYHKVNHLARKWRKGDDGNIAALTGTVERGNVAIEDTRSGQTVKFRINGPDADVLMNCRVPTDCKRIALSLPWLNMTDVNESLSRLSRRGLIFREGDRLVSLLVMAPETDWSAISCPALKELADASP